MEGFQGAGAVVDSIGKRRTRTGLAIVLLASAAASGLLAQVSPDGPQFQVNTYTSAIQRHSAVAMDSDGGFVVVWENSASSIGADTSGSSIEGQVFDARGNPVGGEFQANSYTTGYQYHPSVAMNSDGGFVVVWQSEDADTGDQSNYSIQARRFDGVGAPVGAQFQVNSYTPHRQWHPRVSMNPAGDFVVAWASYGSTGDDVGNSFSIQARRFDSSGGAVGDDFQVNSYTTGDQEYPSVALRDDGTFVVAWQSTYADTGDSSDSSIQARRFGAGGAPVGDQFQVNTYTTNFQASPSVASNGAGQFAIVWESLGSVSDDADGPSIQARGFDSTGAPASGQFQVNTYTTGYQVEPQVTLGDGTGFVVAWTSDGSGGDDSSNSSIQAQRFDAEGAMLGSEYQVNTYTSSAQEAPGLAMDADGNYVVTWYSVGSPGTDQSNFSVQARRFDALFRDGFESGTTDRWSSVAP